MFVKYVKDDDYIIIDSNGKEPGTILVTGSDLNATRSVDMVLNKMIHVRKVEPNGDTLILNSEGRVVRNTAGSKYFKESLPILMEEMGYRISG